MITQEQVDEFFMEFAREMKDRGLFIMDNFIHMWPNLPTIDDLREAEKDEEEDEEDNYDYYY